MKRFLILFVLLSHLIHADFAYDLTQEIGKSQDNWVFSPLSISSCLAMVQLGARGVTADEMRAVLRLSPAAAPLQHTPLSSKDFTLNIAQGMWVREGFSILPSYVEALQEEYAAAVECVPFTAETATKINDWIAQKTNQKIQHLLSPALFTNASRMILANALYFSGKWRSPFSVHNTYSAPFYPSPNQPAHVPFMHQKGFLPYFENDQCKAVALPLLTETDSSLAPVCLLILPHEFDSNPLGSRLISQILEEMSPSRIALTVPKFRVEQQLELADLLQALGMKQVFTPSADLSGIDGLSALYLSDVIHKSFLSFSESGVEAAAATAAVISATSGWMPIPHSPFVIDRPFYFVLAERTTKTILFIGHIQNPCD
ncbi:MAG: serpin family protein [Chlamydiia bacterium]|nr:serpin family protein [Chlamydiia bacterium]